MKKFIGYIFIILAIFIAGFNFLKNDVNLPYFGGRYDTKIINKAENNYRENFIGHKLFVFEHTKDLEEKSLFFNDNEDTKFYRGNFIACMIFLLSLFIMPKMYFGAYLLFFAGLLLINPQRLNYKICLGITLFLALLLRLCILGEYPLWIDEVFTVNVAHLPWKYVMGDYCNPPVFYIISKLWVMLVPDNIYFIRLISVIFGVCGVWSIYYLLKDRINTKTGVVGAILMAFSLWGIYYSQELRGYSFLMFIVPLCTLSMFKMLEEQRNKDYLAFGILSAVVMNTHLYGLLFVVSNFIYVISKKFINLKFCLVVFFTIVSFMPYFFMTFLKNSLLGTNALSGNILVEAIKILGLIFILMFAVIILGLCFKLSKKEIVISNNDFLKYCIYIILSVVAMSFIISIFRLIIYYRYYSVLYPFILSVIAIVISQEWKTKYRGVILVGLILLNIIFQFKFKFPESLRYGNFYDVIKVEQKYNLSKKNIVVVLDYLKSYAKYYDLKGAKTILYKDFDIKNIEPDTSVYLFSFKENKKDLEQYGIVRNLPDNTKLIRIDR